MPIEFDESRFPLVVVRLIGQLTPEENAQQRLFWEKIWQRKQPYVSLVDLSESVIDTGQEENQKTKAWMDANEDLLAKYVVYSITVVTNPAIRALLKTVFFLRKPPYPFEIASSLEEGQRLAEAALGRAILRAREWSED